MSRYTNRWALALLLVSASPEAARAQLQLPTVRARLRSPTDSVRINSVNNLISVANQGLPYVDWKMMHTRAADLVRGRDSVDVALIELLERENLAMRKKTPRTEEYTEYYASVIGIVAGLGDVRGVQGLLGSMGRGTLGQDGLVALGAPVVQRIGPYTRDSDASVRSSALGVLKRIVESRKLDSADREKSKQLFISASRDAVATVRMGAIAGLSSYSDDETRAEFRRIAASDPYRISKAGESRYPLREEAIAWLRKHASRIDHRPQAN